MEPKDKDKTGMIYASNANNGSAAALAWLGHLIGKPGICPNPINKKEIRTKDGTEIKIMMTVEISESIQVFFLRAAQMPKPKPKGTEMMIEMMLSFIEAGSRMTMIEMALWLRATEVERPQSHLVTMLTSQFQ